MSRGGGAGLLLIKPFPGWQPAPWVTAGPSIPGVSCCAPVPGIPWSIPPEQPGLPPGSLAAALPELLGADVCQRGGKGSWRWHPRGGGWRTRSGTSKPQMLAGKGNTSGKPRSLYQTSELPGCSGSQALLLGSAQSRHRPVLAEEEAAQYGPEPKEELRNPRRLFVRAAPFIHGIA